MDVFIGLDVSLASTAICVLGEKGKIVTEAQVASAPDALVSFIRCADHGRKREPGDGHTRDRGPFSVPRSRVSHLLLPRQPPKLTIPGTTIARRRRCFMFKRSCQIVSGRKIVKICA